MDRAGMDRAGMDGGRTKFVFVTGGVASSLGKGLAAAALGALLQARGYKVRLRKFDPYLNVDPGTMSPYQHGEVFVTDDGAETDLDLGHYERFTGVAARRSDSVSSGQVYRHVIERERRGDYLGATVQVVPHVTDAVKSFVRRGTTDEDFVIVEIGGTVGDIEALPIFEAVRQLALELGRDRAAFLHLTLVPYIAAAGELKTKPTQHSVKELRSIGIQPDLILCRVDRPLPVSDRRKIAMFCNVREDAVMEARDVACIYGAPLAYHAEGLDQRLLERLGISGPPQADLGMWREIVRRATQPSGRARIAVVGKYLGLQDAYKSLVEALRHGGIANDLRVELDWVDSEELEAKGPGRLAGAGGILVPGGFGERGAEGKIRAVGFARERGVPYFGICFGMQMAVVEAARGLAGIAGASSTEFGPTSEPVVGLMREWTRDGEVETRDDGCGLGGSMRLGAYPARLAEGSRIARIYGATEVVERHRHRYEVNPAYLGRLERAGLSPDGRLPEAVEIPGHPWFVAVQYHPELRSRPFAPHPLFAAFVAAAAS